MSDKVAAFFGDSERCAQLPLPDGEVLRRHLDGRHQPGVQAKRGSLLAGVLSADG